MFFIIHIKSKNYSSLQKFLNFFYFKSFQKKKIVAFKNMQHYKPKKKVFTILKSPHVNKTAQEQFEYRLHTKKLKVYSSQFFLFLVFLKKIKFNLFADLDFKIELILNKKILLKKVKNKINPDNYILDIVDLGLGNYLNILSKYGKVILKNNY